MHESNTHDDIIIAMNNMGIDINCAINDLYEKIEEFENKITILDDLIKTYQDLNVRLRKIEKHFVILK